MIAWMSNWEYANNVPTMQFRSANTIAREPFLYNVDGKVYLGSRPSPEYAGTGLDKTVKVNGSCAVTLSNENGEEFVIYGGIVYRSIGYIAYQNRNAFQPGSAAYEYVWSIIHNVYGNQYDSEYKK